MGLYGSFFLLKTHTEIRKLQEKPTVFLISFFLPHAVDEKKEDKQSKHSSQVLLTREGRFLCSKPVGLLPWDEWGLGAQGEARAVNSKWWAWRLMLMLNSASITSALKWRWEFHPFLASLRSCLAAPAGLGSQSSHFCLWRLKSWEWTTTTNRNKSFNGDFAWNNVEMRATIEILSNIQSLLSSIS